MRRFGFLMPALVDHDDHIIVGQARLAGAIHLALKEIPVIPIDHLTDDEIRAIYREREVKGWERYMSYPRLRKLVEESGVENLAQIYSKVKYSRESHQEFSQTVLDYLAQQEFMRQS